MGPVWVVISGAFSMTTKEMWSLHLAFAQRLGSVHQTLTEALRVINVYNCIYVYNYIYIKWMDWWIDGWIDIDKIGSDQTRCDVWCVMWALRLQVAGVQVSWCYQASMTMLASWRQHQRFLLAHPGAQSVMAQNGASRLSSKIQKNGGFHKW